MKISLGIGAALLLLCLPCRPAFAGQDVYLLGGATLSNLGGDAAAFGDALAAGIESTIGGSWSSQKKMRTGFDVGLGLGYSKTGPVGGAAEIRYVARGVKWDINELTGSGIKLDTSMKLAYVEIPLLMRVMPQSAGKVHPLFLVGPVLGIRASSTFNAKGPGGSASNSVSDIMKSTYFAGLLGAGINIRTAERSSLLLQARYQLGLSNLIDDPTFSAKPQDFSFLTGYSVGF